MIENPSSVCPLTGAGGVVRRTRTGSDLLQSYQSRFGLTIPASLATAYFDHTFSEHECPGSGLRWFTPGIVGGSDFYEFLAKSLPWYYSAESWDKKHALAVLQRLGCRSMFEVGCGSGALLRAASAAGLTVAGTELNVIQIEAARRAGLAVYAPDKIPATLTADALVMLQVLEHVPRPLEFTVDLVRQVRPRHLLIAVPGFETLLGRTSDPLVWPPHHISFWSARAFAKLAELIGAELVEVTYQPLAWPWFAAVVGTEPDGHLPGLPPLRYRRFLRFAYALGRCLRRPWALRAHTIFAVLKLSA
jgi:SAM-dependent methyltransferase